MTVADPPRARWWSRPWWSIVPESWYLNEETRIERTDRPDRPDRPDRAPRHHRDRDREPPEDLDDTRSFRRRWDDSGPPPPSPKIEVPFGVIVTITLYLIGQLVGGVWWAATLQSDLQHEIMDRAKEEQRLWQTVETYRLQAEALRREMIKAGIRADVP